MDLLGTAIYMMSTVVSPTTDQQAFNPHACLQKILGTLNDAVQVLDKLRAICGTNVWRYVELKYFVLSLFFNRINK